jgi:polyketide-type polyunsaturated fatty acid synthase PfaA
MKPIAIVGMASIFPQAQDLETYWDNIVRERDSITDVPASRWRAEDYYDPDPAAPDKTYCKRGGFIPDIEFDPLEFGLPPNILEVTDVSQLLALIVARQAFEDAGYPASRGYDHERTGVILGIGGGQKLITPLTARLQYPIWERALRSAGLPEAEIQRAVETIKLAYIRWEENSFPGMLGNVIAGRIANRFDLGGINCVTDAACASSLSALKMALSELAEGRCDMMLTGGVDTDNSPFMYLCFSKTPAFSRGDTPRPFDITSDGMMVGEGLGMVVLKRLEDAERDNDRIYAVVRGIGTSSDGRYKSIYAPRSEGQARALRRAYENAGVAPASVGLIEAHGTGTVAGDLCEVTTLRQVFSEDNGRRQHIALGSVKSQIGHTKAAAGAAGLIKAALALHHKVLPPSINVSEPNPKFGLDGSPLYVNTRPRPWLRAAGGEPRRAGVSAFGFGGTNFHVVLEEYEGEHQRPYRRHATAQEIIVAAETPPALLARVETLAAELSGSGATQAFQSLAEASRTLELPTHLARVGFAADGPAEAAERLAQAAKLIAGQPEADSLSHPKGIFYRRTGLETAGRVVALFPGQGSQYVEMGRELAINFPQLRSALGRVDAHAPAGEPSVSEAVFPPPAASAEERAAQTALLQRTDYAQPAIGALSAGLFGLLREAGFQADFAAGHSFGELTALWAAGAIRDDDYFALTVARGRAMAPLADPSFDAGAMLAVAADVAAVQAIMAQVPGVRVANVNAHDQVVLAGTTTAVAHMQRLLKAAGHTATPLPVAAAFHTPLVGHAQAPFSRAVHACAVGRPQIPVYANATAQPYPADPRAVQAMLADQLLQPVHFLQQIENLYAAGGLIFVECGPRSVLTNLVSSILRGRPHVAVALNPSRKEDSDRQLREAAVQLRVAGVPMRGVDTFQHQMPAAAPRRKGLTVSLNGSNYVSDKTRAAFETALAEGERQSAERKTQRAEGSVQKADDQAKPVAVTHEPDAISPATQEMISEISEDTTSMATNVREKSVSPADVLAELHIHQREVLQAHQQFLTYQHEYVRLLLQLPQGSGAAGERELAAMHQLQAETLRVHERFLAQQGEYAAGLVALLGAPTPQAAPQPTTNGVAPHTNGAALPIVAAGDLVPDVARVDTLPAPDVVRTDTPVRRDTMPAPPVLIEYTPPPLHTTSYGRTDAPAPTPATPAPAHVPPAPAPVAPPAPPLDPALAAKLTAGLLEVVSEKTGYPRETLALDMDMESDLGIDSIKRVDILGTMQARYELPRLAPEELAELRTLGQVVEHLRTMLAPASPSAPATPHGSTNVSAPMQSSPAPVQSPAASAQVTPFTAPDAAPAARADTPVRPYTSPAVTTPPAPVPAASPVDPALAAKLTAGLLEVVSEKTGYPRETLALDMDMESDLGIDSIKRVDILGTMQARYELPRLAPEELAELRTLGQVVEHLRKTLAPALASATPAPPATSYGRTDASAPTPATPVPAHAPLAPAPAAPPVDPALAAKLTAGLLEVVSEKTGYPRETLALDMDMESDLGIDSIKRVDILGTMQARYELPRLAPEELAELRTLGQVVEHLRTMLAPILPATNGHITNGHAAYARTDVSAPATPFVPAAPAAPHAPVHLVRLPVPDELESRLLDGWSCVITDDGTATAAILAHSLAERGWQPVVLRLPAALIGERPALPRGIGRVALAELGEQQIDQALQTIADSYGPIGAFIHLHPHHAAGNGAALFSEAEQQIVRGVFLAARRLQPSLTQAARNGWAAFLTVTRLDGALGTAMQHDISPLGGGLFGLTKSLRQEWPGVFCRAVDLSPEIAPEQAAHLIAAELSDPDLRLAEVGHGPHGRVTLATSLAPAGVA